jgi:KEOPS complex subunit Cgi121
MDHYTFMNHSIQIAGYEKEITDLNKVMDFTGSLTGNGTIQLLRAQGIAGKKHLLQATIQALKAFNRNENMAKDLGLEICVRASAQRQISRALKILGLGKGNMEICAVAVDCDPDVGQALDELLGPRTEDVFKIDIPAISKLYKISPAEIETSGNVERVMLERTALLTFYK